MHEVSGLTRDRQVVVGSWDSPGPTEQASTKGDRIVWQALMNVLACESASPPKILILKVQACIGLKKRYSCRGSNEAVI